MLKSILAATLLAVSALVVGVGHIRIAIFDAAIYSMRLVARVTAKVFAGPVIMAQAAVIEQRKRVAVSSFVARIVKRERPLLSSSWRMCPSI